MTSTDGLTFQVAFRGGGRRDAAPRGAATRVTPPQESTPTTLRAKRVTRTAEGADGRSPTTEPAPRATDCTTPPKPSRTEPPTPRLARMLALAYLVEREIEVGRCRDSVAAAERLGITRARMTQITNLATLSPEIQERVLTSDLDATEKDLREIATEVEWDKQLDRLRGIGSVRVRSGES